MYWEDILKDEKDRMGYDFFAGDHLKNDEIPVASLSVKGKTSDGAELKIDSEMMTGPPPGFKQKQKYDFNMATEFKAGSFTWLAAPSDGYTVEYEIQPEDSNKDGKELDVTLAANCNPKGESQDYNASVKLGGHGTDKVKSWSSLDLRVTSGMDFGAGLSENVVIKEGDKQFDIGIKGEFDMSKGLHDVYGAFVASGFTWGKFWLRNNFTGNILGLGASAKRGKQDISWEAIYDYNQKAKQGLLGFPLFLRLGIQTPIGTDGVLTQNLTLGKQYWAGCNFEIAANNQTKFNFMSLCDLKSLFGKPSTKFGCSVEYSL